jgi:hypothetical protein
MNIYKTFKGVLINVVDDKLCSVVPCADGTKKINIYDLIGGEILFSQKFGAYVNVYFECDVVVFSENSVFVFDANGSQIKKIENVYLLESDYYMTKSTSEGLTKFEIFNLEKYFYSCSLLIESDWARIYSFKNGFFIRHKDIALNNNFYSIYDERGRLKTNVLKGREMGAVKSLFRISDLLYVFFNNMVVAFCVESGDVFWQKELKSGANASHVEGDIYVCSGDDIFLLENNKLSLLWRIDELLSLYGSSSKVKVGCIKGRVFAGFLCENGESLVVSNANKFHFNISLEGKNFFEFTFYKEGVFLDSYDEKIHYVPFTYQFE